PPRDDDRPMAPDRNPVAVNGDVPTPNTHELSDPQPPAQIETPPSDQPPDDSPPADDIELSTHDITMFLRERMPDSVLPATVFTEPFDAADFIPPSMLPEVVDAMLDYAQEIVSHWRFEEVTAEGGFLIERYCQPAGAVADSFGYEAIIVYPNSLERAPVAACIECSGEDHGRYMQRFCVIEQGAVAAHGTPYVHMDVVDNRETLFWQAPNTIGAMHAGFNLMMHSVGRY
ncbi:MAG TPA: hypothetical protein VLF67_03335, partial [Candidatus Saccharimonas sp.]|nr:hypothetical protein [Candidatus Saccharimonas sp.]